MTNDLDSTPKTTGPPGSDAAVSAAIAAILSVLKGKGPQFHWNLRDALAADAGNASAATGGQAPPAHLELTLQTSLTRLQAAGEVRSTDLGSGIEMFTLIGPPSNQSSQARDAPGKELKHIRNVIDDMPSGRLISDPGKEEQAGQALLQPIPEPASPVSRFAQQEDPTMDKQMNDQILAAAACTAPLSTPETPNTGPSPSSAAPSAEVTGACSETQGAAPATGENAVSPPTGPAPAQVVTATDDGWGAGAHQDISSSGPPPESKAQETVTAIGSADKNDARAQDQGTNGASCSAPPPAVAVGASDLKHEQKPNNDGRAKAEPDPVAGKDETQPPVEQLMQVDAKDTALIPSKAEQSSSKAVEAASATVEPVIAHLQGGGNLGLTGYPQLGLFDPSKLQEFARGLGCELHPILFTFPPMTFKEYEQLKTSISKTGRLLVPIVTFKKQIVDGLHRLIACMELQISPSFKEWDGQGSLIECVTNLNANRRHLTPSTRAAVAVELLPMLRAEAKHRQQQHGGTAPGRSSGTLPEKIPGVSLGEARMLAAKLCDANPHYVSDLAKVKEVAPDLFDKVRVGEMKVKKAVDLAKSRRQDLAAAACAQADDQEGHQDARATCDSPAVDEGRFGGPADSAVAAGPAKNKKRTTASKVAAQPNHVVSSNDDEDASPCWTPEQVEQKLTEIGEFVRKLKTFAHDTKVRNHIRKMDRHRRKRHLGALRGGGEALASLVTMLSDEGA
jgi:hypothetical protein